MLLKYKINVLPWNFIWIPMKCCFHQMLLNVICVMGNQKKNKWDKWAYYRWKTAKKEDFLSRSDDMRRDLLLAIIKKNINFLSWSIFFLLNEKAQVFGVNFAVYFHSFMSILCQMYFGYIYIWRLFANSVGETTNIISKSYQTVVTNSLSHFYKQK